MPIEPPSSEVVYFVDEMQPSNGDSRHHVDPTVDIQPQPQEIKEGHAAPILNRVRSKRSLFPTGGSGIYNSTRDVKSTCAISSENLKFSGTNILSYDPSWLVSYGWLLPTDASILHTKFMIFKVAFIVGITTALAVVKCPAADDELTYAGTVLCVALPSDWKHLTLITIASFMMALFTRTLLDRWWQTRKHISSTGGRCKLISMFLAAWTSNAGPDVAELRTRAIRLLNFAHALLFYTPTTKEDLRPLIDAHLCEEDEAALVATLPDPYMTVLGWVATILKDLNETHHAITEMQLHDLNTLLIDLRNNAADAFLFIGTQLPYAAIQLITMMVYAFEIQLLAVSSGVIGLGLETGDYDQVFMGYFTIILASEIYLGLLHLYSALSNPFGDDPWDFPSMAYQDSLLKTTTAIHRAVPEGPASLGILRVAGRRHFGGGGGGGGAAAAVATTAPPVVTGIVGIQRSRMC